MKIKGNVFFITKKKKTISEIQATINQELFLVNSKKFRNQKIKISFF